MRLESVPRPDQRLDRYRKGAARVFNGEVPRPARSGQSTAGTWEYEGRVGREVPCWSRR